MPVLVCWLSVGFRQMEIRKVVFKQARDCDKSGLVHNSPGSETGSLTYRFYLEPGSGRGYFHCEIRAAFVGDMCHRAMCRKSWASFFSLGLGATARRKPEWTPELNRHRCPSAKHQLLRARKRRSSPLWPHLGLRSTHSTRYDSKAIFILLIHTNLLN